MKVALFVVVALAIACASAFDVPRKQLGSFSGVAEGWNDEGIAPESDTIAFTLYLYQRNLDILDSLYEDRTNPQSPNYRKWMTIEELNKIVAPSAVQKAKVFAWLKYAHVEYVDQGDALKCRGSVLQVSDLFNTEFHKFTYAANPDRSFIRQVGDYSIPEDVSDVVEFISGISGLPSAKRMKAHNRPVGKNVGDNETGKVVPYVINGLYNISTSSWGFNTNSSVCLAEFQNDRSFAASDLSAFQTQNALPSNPVYKIVGPYSPTVPDAEATLDVQYGSAVAVNAPVWFWTVDGWMLEFANNFYSTAVVPYIVSMSWGWTETDQCQITSCNGMTSAQYVAKCNTEFQKIGLRGVTLLAASGDQGAPGDGDPYCIDTAAPISSIYPGASPYVTSVGATMLVPPTADAKAEQDGAAPPVCTTYDCADPTWPEVACSYPQALITSGGGFSAYSPRPSWQNTVVSKYLSSGVTLPPATAYNASNRGFPDVSAVGHNYLIYIGGHWEIVDGTSCSTPVWAGMIGLWNDLLLNAGKGTLGPVNALLYQMYASNPSTFKDITSGNNNCSESKCCQYGYTATTGWDAVTGLGVPNFPAITSYIQSTLL